MSKPLRNISIVIAAIWLAVTSVGWAQAPTQWPRVVRSPVGVGGSTVASPGLKASTTTLQVTLADGSAQTDLQSKTLTTQGDVASGGNVSAAAASKILFTGRTRFASPSDGVLTLTNAAETAFTRAQFGGTTSSFPAIKRNGAALNFRLADDSADADVTSGAISASGTITDTAGTIISTGAVNGLVRVNSAGASASYVEIQRGAATKWDIGAGVLANDNDFVFYSPGFGGTAVMRLNQTTAAITTAAGMTIGNSSTIGGSFTINGSNVLKWNNGGNSHYVQAGFTTNLDFKYDNSVTLMSLTPTGAATITGVVTVPSVQTTPVAVASLPTCNAGADGQYASVTDATLTIITGLGLAVVGGSTNHVPVYCDGTSWKAI